MSSRFHTAVSEAVRKFKALPQEKQIKIISHLDADGLAASAILAKALMRAGRNYSVRTFPSLTDVELAELASEKNDQFVFCDLGSAKLDTIQREFKGKQVFILDHHTIQGSVDDSIVHLNPRLYEINGGLECCGAGIAYFFAKELDNKNIDLAHIALVGAVGDSQERNGFFGVNKEILLDAETSGKLKVSEGLRLFGVNTKPLHKVLEHCDSPFIPGVSGSEQGALTMLQELGINPKTEGEWKKIVHLSDEDVEKLVQEILKRRAKEERPQDIMGKVYAVVHEQPGTPFRDLREFATVLNACGRLNEVSCGIAACLGDPKMKAKAITIKKKYREEINKALRIIKQNKMFALTGDEYFLFNAETAIIPTIAGTVTSIMAKGKWFDEGTVVIVMVRNNDNTTKISARIAGKNVAKKDLCALFKDMLHPIGGDYGGHAGAAGALIKTEHEDAFMTHAQEVLKKKGLEETI